jgi:hypothetical protein
MNRLKRVRIAILVLVALLVPKIEPGLAKSKNKKHAPRGTPILWQRPNNIASRDLLLGPGGTSMRPDLRRITRSRNNPKNYAKSDFLEKVKGNRVVLHFGGKNRGLMKDITVNDAIWLGSWLAQLNDDQIRDAFRAANYTPDQVDLLTRVVRARTNELLSLRPNIQIGSGQ